MGVAGKSEREWYFSTHLYSEVGYYIERLIPFSKLEEHNIVKVHETAYVVFWLRYGKGVKKCFVL